MAPIGKIVGNGWNLQNLPTFGPVYPLKNTTFLKDKERIYYVVSGIAAGGGKYEAAGRIKSAIREGAVFREASMVYDSSLVSSLGIEKFESMMIRDGCFYLQLVINYFGLGVPVEIEYDNRAFLDPVKLKELVLAMFIPGNQIPLSVLLGLATHGFFVQAMARTQNWKQPVGWLETVLWDELVHPAKSNRPLDIGYPCDLLRALHSKIVWRGADPNYGNEINEINEILTPTTKGNDKVEKFPSASKLRKSGICFHAVSKKIGCRGICFRKCEDRFGFMSVYFPGGVGGVLGLPRLEVDSTTEFMLRCLISYEECQGLRRREVGGYCRLLSDLVITLKDSTILEAEGIITGQIKELPRIVGALPSIDDPGNRLTKGLLNVRLEVEDYTRKRLKVKEFRMNVVLVLAAIASIYTILEYYKK